MESQTEIVAAAEALRTWVRGQRASWADGDRASASVSALSRPAPAWRPSPPVPASAPVTAPPAAPPPSHPAVATTPALAPVPAPAPVHEPTPAPEPTVAHAATQVVDAPSEWPSTPYAGSGSTVIVAEPTFFARLWVRVAMAAVLLLAVVGGYMGVSRRSALAIGAAAFASTPEGAEVHVDGKPVGRTPVRVELGPGAHAVEFRLASATRTQTIVIARGADLPVSVDWNAKPIGSLQVSSTPSGARVSIDGKLRGQTPLSLDDLPAGPHTVVIDSTEGTVRRKVQIAAGGTETLNESIYPGWLHVSAPIDVTILDGGTPALLDDGNRVLLKPGMHTVRIENRELAFSQTRQVEIEPGGTTKVAVEVPTSTLSVTGSTGAEVFVDGVKAGETPLADFKVALGTHDVMVVGKTGATRHATARVTTRPLQLDISLDRP